MSWLTTSMYGEQFGSPRDRLRPTCSDGISRAMLHHTVTHETAAAHSTSSRLVLNDVLTSQLEVMLHNLTFQAQGSPELITGWGDEVVDDSLSEDKIRK